MVHAGHLGRLAADQRAAGLPAALRDAADDACGGGDVELAGGEVVEEEQRLGALGQQVVDAHRDEVDADGAVQAGVDRDLELGADAVVGGDQDRVLEAGALQIEQRAEAAEVGVRARPAGRAGERLDGADERIAGIDIDPGITVGERGAGRGAGRCAGFGVAGFGVGGVPVVLGFGHAGLRRARRRRCHGTG